MSAADGKHLRVIIQTQTEIADGDEMVYRVTTGEETPFQGVRLAPATPPSCTRQPMSDWQRRSACTKGVSGTGKR
jgi:hypothetical protein